MAGWQALLFVVSPSYQRPAYVIGSSTDTASGSGSGSGRGRGRQAGWLAGRHVASSLSHSIPCCQVFFTSFNW